VQAKLCVYDSKKAVAECKKCGSPVCDSCLRTFLSDTLCKVCTIKIYSRRCSLVRYDSDEA
jgi:hypothetical protein